MSDYDLPVYNLTKTELLANMQQGWDDLMRYLMRQDMGAIIYAEDAAGWTPKDHLMHLAVWADGVTAMLDQKNRYEFMGLDREVWDSGDYDRMNNIIQKRYRDRSIEDVRAALEEAHAGLVAKVEVMSEDDLRRPYNFYQPYADGVSAPVIRWIVVNTYEHYQEHTPWIDAIVRGWRMPPELLVAEMRRVWTTLDGFLNDLTPEQMTVPTDAGGWTIKDHIIHLAVWADGIDALLDKRSRHEAMGLDAETWEAHEVDTINAVIQRAHKYVSLEEACAELKAVHDRLTAKFERMTTDDLYRPYSAFAPQEGEKRLPVVNWIPGNTYAHYAEHLPWMRTIAAQS